MPDYSNTSTLPSPQQLAALFNRHIPPRVRLLALQGRDSLGPVDEITDHIRASKVLDIVGEDRIATALADGVPLHLLCSKLDITKGNLMVWMHATPDRMRKIIRAVQSSVYMNGLSLRQEIIEYRDVMDEDTVRSKKLQLDAVRDVEKVVVPGVDNSAKGDGVRINIDLGSLFGGSQSKPPPKVIN